MKTKSPTDLANFKQYRNKVTSFLKNEKRNFLYNEFDKEFCDGSAQVWKKVNKLLSRAQSASGVTELVFEGERIEGVELAEKFNTFFKDTINTGPSSNFACNTIRRNNNSIFLEPTDDTEVCSIFTSFKTNRSCDIDGIQITPVKFVLSLIAPALTHIYNLALSTGSFPRQMQKSKVTVLYKSGDKNSMSSYRPISILPLFSKGLEKIIHKRLVKFCNSFKLLSTSQHGFLRGRSTESALLSQKEIILSAFENKELCVGIFIDFSKAFDHLNHHTLLKKLELYGIRGTPLELLKSYLRHRLQCVKIGQHTSSFQNVTAGVPQGSILGPLLFILYINDLVLTDGKPKFVIYADDASLFFTGSSIQSLVPVINNSLAKLKDWSDANSLLINTKKTKAVLFSTRQFSTQPDMRIYIGNSQVEFIDTVKILGVFFNNTMSWDTEVQSILGNLAKCTGILAKFRHFLPERIKLVIYNALFVSHLNYCFLVWGTTTKTNINKIHMLQKKALRYIANVDYLAHTQELFIRYKILPINTMYEYYLALKYKRCIQNNQLSFLELPCLRQNLSEYSFRKKEIWHIPFSRTMYGQQMLRHTLPTLLNKLLSKGIIPENCSLVDLRSALSD